MTTVRSGRMLATLGLGCLVLASCGGDDGTPREILTRRDIAEQGLGDDRLGTDGSTLGDAFRGATTDEGTGGSLRVNKHLWRGALDTLSFLPLASTDPFSGVIVTDWGTPEGAQDERFKVTVFIADERLNTETLRVAVFREIRGPQGWVSAPVADQVPRGIEDAILTRARQLRIAEREGVSAG